jgi:hypothetical protein
MRKEASKEQWGELYDAAMMVKQFEPWEGFYETDLITILLPGYEMPFYVSVMGSAGECFGIAIYDGFEGITDFLEMIDGEEVPMSQRARFQNCLTCFLGNREELTKKELQLIKDMGLKFRGRNEWIYFRSFKRGYQPHMLDKEEVAAATEILRQLFMAIKAFVEQRFEVDFEGGETLFRRYDAKEKLWYTFPAPLILPPREYPVPLIEDQLLVSRLKKKKATATELEIDPVVLGTVVNDKKYDRPVMPLLLVVADHKNGMVLWHEMLTPEDDEMQVILGTVVEYIMQMGRPKAIFIRDKRTQAILSDLCSRTGIPLKVKGSLKAIDSFLNDYENRT